MSSAEEARTKETATVLNKVATAAFPAEGLAPWMSDYNKQTNSVVVITKTIAAIAEELDRQVWMKEHPDEPVPEGEEAEEQIFDLSKLKGAAFMYGFGLNALASNIHNYAPSIDGKRTRQAIALAKANNPGVFSAQPDQKKRSLFDKILGKGKEKE